MKYRSKLAIGLFAVWTGIFILVVGMAFAPTFYDIVASREDPPSDIAVSMVRMGYILWILFAGVVMMVTSLPVTKSVAEELNAKPSA